VPVCVVSDQARFAPSTLRAVREENFRKSRRSSLFFHQPSNIENLITFRVILILRCDNSRNIKLNTLKVIILAADTSSGEGLNNVSGMRKLEIYSTDRTRDVALISGITDISFPDSFESLHMGWDSSDRVLRTIIEGLLEGRYRPGGSQGSAHPQHGPGGVRQLVAHPGHDYAEMYVRNHRRVTDAVVNGDPAGAEAAYQYHIDWTNALISGERPPIDPPWVKSVSRACPG